MGSRAARPTGGSRRSPGRSGPGGSPGDLLGVEPHHGPVLLDEIPAGGRADLLRPDSLDLREERLREVPRAEAFARAEQHALEGDAVLLVPRPGADLLVGPREFRLRRGRPRFLFLFPRERGPPAGPGQGGGPRRRAGGPRKGPALLPGGPPPP